MQPPDTLPTLLNLAGLTVTPPEPFHGRSMATVLRGHSEGAPREFAITAQHLRRHAGARQSSNWTTPVLYTKRWAYAPIGANRTAELYDITSDPYAQSDVASEQPVVVPQLHEKLIAWLRELDTPPEAIEVLE